MLNWDRCTTLDGSGSAGEWMSELVSAFVTSTLVTSGIYGHGVPSQGSIQQKHVTPGIELRPGLQQRSDLPTVLQQLPAGSDGADGTGDEGSAVMVVFLLE